MEFLRDKVDSSIDSLFDMGGVESSFDFFEALFINGAGQDGCGGGAVSCLIICLIGNILNKAGSDVQGLFREINGFGHGHSVLGDLRAAVALVDENVASSRPKGNFNSTGKLSAAFEQFLAGSTAE
jgi:hypothetical protein